MLAPPDRPTLSIPRMQQSIGNTREIARVEEKTLWIVGAPGDLSQACVYTWVCLEALSLTPAHARLPFDTMSNKRRLPCNQKAGLVTHRWSSNPKLSQSAHACLGAICSCRDIPEGKYPIKSVVARAHLSFTINVFPSWCKDSFIWLHP